MQERDESSYVEGIKNRAEKLIANKVWQEIDAARFQSWYSQFETYGSELLGACLTDALIYRSKSQVEALLSTIFTSWEMLGSNSFPYGDMTLVEALANTKDPNVRLCPVIRMSDPPTKSGMYVLRLLSKMFKIRDTWLKWPAALVDEPDTLRTVILVDDFCGSGNQFTKFITDSKFNEFLTKNPNCRIVYAVVAAHRDGIDSINQKHSRIEIIAGEVLDSKAHFFNAVSQSNLEDQKVQSQILNDYDKLLTRIGLCRNFPSLKHGYQSQALTYAFSHATPNNTLPIYWAESNNWKALLHR